MNLRIFDSLDDLARAAARTIVQHARPGAAIALSGGSTPKPVYEILGRAMATDAGERGPGLAGIPITWVVVDERYVPLTDPQSNAAMMQRTLFAAGIPPGHRFLRFRTELNDPAATARQFEEEWRALGIESLDLIVLGVGDDGHTASLFPGTSVLGVDDRIASEVFVPRLDQWRVTLTLPVIRSAKQRIVLAAGASKEPILRQAVEGAEYPIVSATAGTETWWLVDRAAAGKTEDESR
jgi:6-phosphogluconolactonase